MSDERQKADTIGTALVPGLAISNAKNIFFSNKIYGSNFTESIRRLLRFEIAEMPTAV